MSRRAGGRDGQDAVPEGGASADGVAAVVVNYRSGPALARCVEALDRQGPAELVVVDNGSSDGSVAELRRRVPGVCVIDPGANLGYGAAANRGAAATGAPCLLVCNSDLEVGSEAIIRLAEALSARPGCGAVGPLIRDASGARYPSARRFPSLVDAAGHAVLGLFAPANRFTRAYHQAELAGSPEARDVDWLSGACLLFRRSAFEELGGFDESYFMYAEDVDLCWRLGEAGWTVTYVPDAEVTHLQGISTNAHPYRMILEHHRSLLRFAVRSSSGWRRLALPLVAAGLGLRAILESAVRLAQGRTAASGAADTRL